MEGLILFSIILFPLSRYFRLAGQPEGQEYKIAIILYYISISFHFLLGMICGSGLLVGTLITFPLHFILLIITMVNLFHPSEMNDATFISRIGARQTPLTTLSGCIALITITANFFGILWWNNCTEFKSGKLQGICYPSEMVVPTEDLIEFLAPRLKKGDFLISIGLNGNPMLHYLTDSRAALPTGYLNKVWPETVNAMFVRTMIERHRVPRYAVTGICVQKEPVFNFIMHNYKPIKSFSPYLVWKHL